MLGRKCRTRLRRTAASHGVHRFVLPDDPLFQAGLPGRPPSAARFPVPCWPGIPLHSSMTLARLSIGHRAIRGCVRAAPSVSSQLGDLATHRRQALIVRSLSPRRAFDAPLKWSRSFLQARGQLVDFALRCDSSEAQEQASSSRSIALSGRKRSGDVALGEHHSTGAHSEKSLTFTRWKSS